MFTYSFNLKSNFFFVFFRKWIINQNFAILMLLWVSQFYTCHFRIFFKSRNEVRILQQSQQEVCLVEIKNCVINFWDWILVDQIQLSSIAHQQSFELCRCILAQTAGAKADAAAELANPGARISTLPKFLIVAHLQTHVAKLAATSILGLLRKLQVSF